MGHLFGHTEKRGGSFSRFDHPEMEWNDSSSDFMLEH